MKLFRYTLASLFVAMMLVPSILRAGEFPDSLFYPVEPAQREKLDQLVGKPAPVLALTDWINGEVKPADMLGKVVVVDIWATWCPPCVASIPHNNELAEKYKDKGLIVVGVCTSTGQDKMEKVAADKGIKYPVGKDASLENQKAWGAIFYPTYAVIDRAGKVRAIGLAPDGVEKVVEKLLAEAPSANAN